jgi:uncharacterized membrane protein
MTRIFTTLALFAFAFAAVTMIIGLSIDLYNNPTLDDKQWAQVHRLAGVGAGIAIVFVSSIVMTYFIGTSRWCKEVAETYSLDPQFVRRSTALKRRAFPWASGTMLTAVAMVALGGAADPGTMRPNTESWVIPHLIGAIVGMAFVAWAFFIQWQYIAANHEVIDEVMAEVHKIRSERGLEV